LIGSAERLSAVRLEVPARRVSKMIRWDSSGEEVPESTPALRAIADAKGVAYSPEGLVVVLVRRAVHEGAGPRAPAAGAPGKGPTAYVTVRADFNKIVSAVESIGQRSFQDGAVSLFVATPEGRLVAAYGVPGKKPGDSATDLPIWRGLSAESSADMAL